MTEGAIHPNDAATTSPKSEAVYKTKQEACPLFDASAPGRVVAGHSGARAA
jgi:hypothetical protein